MKKCKSRNKLLRRCRMKPLQGEDYCFIHHPDKEEERKLARSRGGKGRSKPYQVDRHSASITEAYSEPPTSQKTMKDGYIARSGPCPRCLFSVEPYSEGYGGGPGTYYCPSCGLGGGIPLNPFYRDDF